MATNPPERLLILLSRRDDSTRYTQNFSGFPSIKFRISYFNKTPKFFHDFLWYNPKNVWCRHHKTSQSHPSGDQSRKNPSTTHQPLIISERTFNLFTRYFSNPRPCCDSLDLTINITGTHVMKLHKTTYFIQTVQFLCW